MRDGRSIQSFLVDSYPGPSTSYPSNATNARERQSLTAVPRQRKMFFFGTEKRSLIAGGTVLKYSRVVGPHTVENDPPDTVRRGDETASLINDAWAAEPVLEAGATTQAPPSFHLYRSSRNSSPRTRRSMPGIP